MRIRRIYRFFSFVLLGIYSVVIFQQGVIDGIHFISHASEILTDTFSFHSHESGNLHVHHHDFMETVEKMLHHDDHRDNSNQDEIPFQQQQIKLHLPEVFFAYFNDIYQLSQRNDGLVKKLIPVSLEVLTPPPQKG